jgi:lysozyme family protein
MAELFQECLNFTLAQEGGYVDDPHDPGGATNLGITLATYRCWDHDPALGPGDVEALSRQTAAAIYHALYWNALCGHSLPPGVDLTTFDFGVNTGTRRSAKLLQRAVGFAGDEVDGVIGPETLRAVLAADATRLVQDLAVRQADFYRDLAQFDRFGQGWLARTARRKEAALALFLRAQQPTLCGPESPTSGPSP